MLPSQVSRCNGRVGSFVPTAIRDNAPKRIEIFDAAVGCAVLRAENTTRDAKKVAKDLTELTGGQVFDSHSVDTSLFFGYSDCFSVEVGVLRDIEIGGITFQRGQDGFCRVFGEGVLV